MTAGPSPLQPNRAEWLHGSRYFLLALALHVALLLYPLKLAIDGPDATPPAPVQVTLTESISPPPAIPPLMSVKPPVRPAPRRDKPAPATPPVIAMAPQPASLPSAITVPAPAPAQPIQPAAPTPSSATAQATVSAARFDAAYLHNPPPKYPPISRRMGEEGKVLLKVRVTPDGRAAAVDVEKSSNFERLDEVARQTVANWRFVPARRGDDAIEATVIVPMVFRLEN